MTAVYFNLDLTLTEMSRSFDDVVVAVLEGVGVPPDEADSTAVSRRFFERFRDLEPRPWEGAFGAHFDEAGIDASPEAAARRLQTLEVDAVHPAVDDLPSLVRDLQTRHSVGVLTSGLVDVQRRKLAKLGLDDVLDDVAISYERNATKESGGLFRAAEAELEADEYVYVSTHESDVEAAREAGWRAVLAGPRDLEPTPVETLETLLDDR